MSIIQSNYVVFVMAAFTEFANLATMSVDNASDQNPSECGNVGISIENPSCENGYKKASRKESRSSNVDSAVFVKDTNHAHGTTVSFRNLQYSVKTKKERKKCTKVIVKGIR